MITLCNLKNTSFKNLPTHVKVDRSSPLGNTFIMKNQSLKERHRVCNEYYKWLHTQINVKNKTVTDELNRLYKIHKQYGELTLYCWCVPLMCHSESIKAVLELYI